MVHNKEMRALDLLVETISKNEIVPVIGAGIHAMNEKNGDQNIEWRSARRKLKQWDSLLSEAAERMNLEVDNIINSEVSPTLKWEMIINLIPGNEPARKKELKFIDVIQNVAQEAEQRVLENLTCYQELQSILQHSKVFHIISLNIEFIVEYLLYGNNDIPRPTGSTSLVRKTEINNKIVWHPHGDYKNKKTITFGLRQYSQTIKDLERARNRYKQYEIAGNEPVITSWVDLFMSKPLLFLGTSINPAEWDIWFAMVNRWRNFGKDKYREKEPKVFCLARDNEANHLPSKKFNIIKCKDYSEGWNMLQPVFM